MRAEAVLIEDKVWPRPLGRGGAKLVVELLARTDARASRGFDEALARIRAVVAAGADILLLDAAIERGMRTGIEACDGKPALAVISRRASTSR